ncbi:MAG: LLM class flavin-dependent oxidoreductase [Saprospiraceae bacterium]
MNQNYRNIAYSRLNLALISDGTSTAETLKNSLKLAQAAEDCGYTRFWLAEHHNSISIASAAPQILIGYIAGGTKKIRVGSGGIMLPNHSSLVVSEQFGTLGALYPNRIDLGLGRAPGTDGATANAINPSRMQATYAFPQEIDKIQQYFSTNNSGAAVRANVAEGVNVPLYILGSSTDSAYLAAKKGLPYAFASHFATTHLFDALNIYYNNFQPSEYLKEPYSMAGVNVIIGETDEAAEQMLTTLIKGIVGILTGKRSYLQPPCEMTQELREVAKHPAVRQMLKYSFVGNKETVKQQTAEFLSKTGVNELIAVTNIYDINDRIKSYQTFAEIMGEMKYGVEEKELDTVKQ